MYYNIKIITQDSEFGLESGDRAIIEREMDIYFARIFGASAEFVSKIKPVVINNPKVKSISEIDRPSVSQSTKQVQQQTVAPQSAELKKIEKPKAEENNAINQTINTYNTVLPTADTTQEKSDTQADSTANTAVLEKEIYSQLNNIFSEMIEPDITAVNSDINYNKNVSDDFKIEMPKQEELENEAEALYRELQVQVEEQKRQENTLNFTSESLEGVEKIVEENNTQLNNADANTINKIEELPEKAEEEITEESTPETEIVYEDTKDEVITENTEQKTDESSFENNENNDSNYDVFDSQNEQVADLSENQNNPNDDFMNDYNAINLTEEITGHMLHTPDDSKNKESKEDTDTNSQEQAPVLSFNKFLSGFMTDEIHDEFLICCAYIKNVLNQDTFTIKYINSKLFQTTGKIADTTILDDLVKKEYIRVVSANECTLYSIAPKGEEYLANKLPG